MKKYILDGFSIKLNDEHMLPVYQHQLPMYDRFVPFLGMLANMSADGSGQSLILDIGANVGDTVAGFIKHTNARAICVEPTEEFFNLCKENVAGFGEQYSKRITLVQAYISSNMEKSYASKVSKGTASMMESNSGGAPTYTIPYLMKKLGEPLERLSVVKVDTDGYDAKCISSFEETLKKISPILYWENQIENDEQLINYIQLVDYLYSCGYRAFYVFDNFGNYICKVDADGMKNFNDYLAHILHGASARTFFYVDVLAAKPNRISCCEIAVHAYLSKYS